MTFDADLLREIKAHADIKDVIESFIPVYKKGRNYVAVCPFHDDHDPSMHIDIEKQMFMCFVCHTGGDVFNFVKNYEHISFSEAVVRVAEIVNFDDPRLHQEKRFVKKVDDNLVPLYNCINDLQKFYQYGLTTEEGKIARDYLFKRGISNEQIEKFGLGYALNDGAISVNYLKGKKYSLKNIENIGVALASQDNMSDRNAGRLIFPIYDGEGQVVGFSARKLNNEKAINPEEKVAKYVNSPETPIFKKGFILYNLHNAKKTCKHDGYIYLVEGFMDVFSMDVCGIHSVVALMGTNLTTDQVMMLKRLNVEVRLCLDGDSAGQKGMMRITSMFDSAAVNYRIVSKPGELRDPDEIFKQDGKDALCDFLNMLVDPFNFALNFYENTYKLTSKEEKEKVVKHFIPMLASTKNKLEYDDYLYKLSKVTGFDIRAIQSYADANKNMNQEIVLDDSNDFIALSNFEDSNLTSGLNLKRNLKRLTLAERAVLLQMINYPEAVRYYKKNIKDFVDDTNHRLTLYILDYVDQYGSVDVSSIMDNISLSDEGDKDALLSSLSTLSMISDVPPYSEQTMNQYTSIMNEEKANLADKQELDEEISGKTEEDKIRAMKEYLEKKSLELKNNKRAK